jgi:hypothetical protein
VFRYCLCWREEEEEEEILFINQMNKKIDRANKPKQCLGCVANGDESMKAVKTIDGMRLCSSCLLDYQRYLLTINKEGER